MSAPAWRPPAPVIDQLLLAPQGFGFFQAVRLLERWLGVEAGGGLDRIHFRTSLSMGFPASEIESLQAHWSHSDLVKLPAHLERIDLTPACMGLLGVSGALPLFYTELVSQAETQGRNRSARAFLEVFSHRSVTLFYQAWRKHRLAVQFESDRRRAFLPQVLALGGLGLRGLRERMSAPEGGVADEGLAYFAGALQQRTLPAQQLQKLLQRHLGTPVEVEPFVGRWYRVPDAGRTHLGTSGVLGRTALVGERVWQRNLRMRLTLGPLDAARFGRFLPGGAGALALRQWLGLLYGPALEFEIRLSLRRDHVQPCVLRSDRPQQFGRLGWDTFMLSQPASTDRSDVRYDIQAAA
jgi:type VI secretion system protein ImpH